MRLKSICSRGAAICLSAVILFSTVPPAVSGRAPAAAPTNGAVFLRGDITGDGVVDGRDALRIMRVVEGYETATPDELARGDVYPLPGTGGRLVGDGQLTRHDAEKLLRSSVGLVSLGEITGDYSGSWPVVERFEPASGRAGTQLTVYGANFIAGSPGENIVYIGETLAPVRSSTGAQLVVTVPEAARTGRVRVITPAGEGISALDFQVMAARAGRLVPPAGLRPNDFTVTNSVGDQAQPDADGGFTIPTDSYGVTMLMALPKAAGDERVLMQMDIAGGQALAALAAVDDPAVMDLLATAQGMVFLSPYLAAADVAHAEATMAVIADDPQVQALAALLAQLYGEAETPLDDPRFDEAYLRAVESVLNRLPAGMALDLGAPVGQGNGDSVVAPPESVLNVFGARAAGDVQFFHLASQAPDAPAASDWRWQAWYPEDDFMYTTAKAGVQPGQIVASVEPGNPVDWVVQLAEVADIYSVLPAGKQSLAGLDPRRVLPRGAYHSLSGARADSTLKYINLFGLGFNAVWEALGQAVTDAAPGLKGSLTPGLQVDPAKDAVYVVRAYSGMLNSGADAGEFDFVYDTLPDGRMAYLAALGQNAAWAGVDALTVAISYKSYMNQSALQKAIQKGIDRAIARSPRSLLSAAGFRLILEIAHDVIKDALYGIASSAVGDGIAKITFKIIGKSLNPLTALGRVSAGAQSIERLASLVGFNWRMSPLETWIVVVGDPFTPVLERVTPDAVKPGDVVTLIGRNFDGRGIANNQVRLGGSWPSALPIEVQAVSQDGRELRVTLPDDAPPGVTSVWIKVPYRPTPIMFEVEEAHDNTITAGQVSDNGGDGIRLGAQAANTTVQGDGGIYGNGEGIALASGGNGEIAAPIITRLSHRGANIEGTAAAPDGSIVEVFADASDEGALFLGQATVRGGQFHLDTQVPPGMKLHATVTDPNGNTSEFGPANLSGPPLADYVFTSTREGNEEVYLGGSGLASARRLTARPAADNSPRLCAPGDQVLFASDALGSWDIWRVNSDGTGLEQLTKDPGSEFDPACSPAGNQLAYSDGRDILAAALGGAPLPQELAYDDGAAEFAYGLPLRLRPRRGPGNLRHGCQRRRDRTANQLVRGQYPARRRRTGGPGSGGGPGRKRRPDPARPPGGRCPTWGDIHRAGDVSGRAEPRPSGVRVGLSCRQPHPVAHRAWPSAWGRAVRGQSRNDRGPGWPDSLRLGVGWRLHRRRRVAATGLPGRAAGLRRLAAGLQRPWRVGCHAGRASRSGSGRANYGQRAARVA